jgi:hypothetical protein
MRKPKMLETDAHKVCASAKINHHVFACPPPSPSPKE